MRCPCQIYLAQMGLLTSVITLTAFIFLDTLTLVLMQRGLLPKKKENVYCIIKLPVGAGGKLIYTGSEMHMKM